MAVQSACPTSPEIGLWEVAAEIPGRMAGNSETIVRSLQPLGRIVGYSSK